MLQTTPPQAGDAEAHHPTLFLAAPAVLDRIFSVVKAKISAAPAPIKAWFTAALEDGAAHYDAGGVGANPLLGLIFKPVQKLLGGRVQLIGTGSAPLGMEIAKFCQTAFNCPVIQGYGLTETTAVSCIGLPTSNEHCVGPPVESACIRLRDWAEGNYLAADESDPTIGMRRGEVLIGGAGVSLGYLVDDLDPDPEVCGAPAAACARITTHTHQARAALIELSLPMNTCPTPAQPCIDPVPSTISQLVEKNATDYVTIDGVRYFCTGDIGQITVSGGLQIIDRKKDLVKLAHGEYIALSKVENVLKSSRFVSVPNVYARSTMSYAVALICPTAAINEIGAQAGLKAAKPPVAGTMPTEEWKQLCANKDVCSAVLSDLKEVCKGLGLNKFETPARCVLIDEEFSVENDMMTAVVSELVSNVPPACANGTSPCTNPWRRHSLTVAVT